MIGESFSEYGTVMAVRLPTDQESGRPKGFGYVQFSSVDEARAAFQAMNGADIAGRNIRLDYSIPRDRSAGGDRGDRGGRGRGGPRGGGRGGRGGRGGGFRGGRGGFAATGANATSTNRGGVGEYAGKKVTFD